MRGECPVGGVKVTGYFTPSARYCAITGGEYAITASSGAADEQGTCSFKGGGQCDAWDYLSGNCGRVVRKPLSEGSQQSPGKSEWEGRLPVGLQRGIQAIGVTRDMNYPATYPNFRLRKGTDEFVIV